MSAVIGWIGKVAWAAIKWVVAHPIATVILWGADLAADALRKSSAPGARKAGDLLAFGLDVYGWASIFLGAGRLLKDSLVHAGLGAWDATVQWGRSALPFTVPSPWPEVSGTFALVPPAERILH